MLHAVDRGQQAVIGRLHRPDFVAPVAEGLGGVQAFDEGVNGADADIEFPKSVLQTGVRPAVYWGYAIGIGILIAGFRRVRILARG